ncbi:MAG: sulfatase-like hydrolase/transferase [Planctomycetota bacterium]
MLTRISWLALAVFFAASQVYAVEPTAHDRPNIVLILIDDLSPYGINAYGASQIGATWGQFEGTRPYRTPRLDELAHGGARGTHAYAYPLCEPSRIALMTGQYNSRNYLRPKSQHGSDITFGDIFQREGYATGMFGKWKQTRGTQDIPGKDYIAEFGWDEFACFDVIGEGQRFINPNLVINGEVVNYKGRDDVDPDTGRRWYGPDIFNRYALDFIDRHRDEPFFLYYPMALVHDEHKPTPDTKPDSLFDTADESTKYDEHRYITDMIEYTDTLIGRVVDRLDEHGLLENTVVMVIGDNGTKESFYHVLDDGTEYFGGKGGTKDNGMRVPMIVSAPGRVSGGQVYDGLIDIVDILPTLCEAAGITPPAPAGIDGISFWPQITGADGEHRDTIYAWYNANTPATDTTTRLLRFAFDKDFKRYAPHKAYPNGRFFDLRTDPMEEVGDRREYPNPKWKVHFHSSGLDPASLDAEQRAAYDALGEVIGAHAYVAVDGVDVTPSTLSLAVGEMANLDAAVTPAEATRQNVMYESSDPSVLTVDKFGAVTAIAPGEAEVLVYAWDDAWPLADNKQQGFNRDGVQASTTVRVR